MKKTIKIDYYTDVLCIWAWIVQERIIKLYKKFGKNIEIHYHYINIFGKITSKSGEEWGERVLEVASKFENIQVNEKLRLELKPTTSANAHLILKAVELISSKQKFLDFDLIIRKAFFKDAIDISDLSSLIKLANDHNINNSDLNKVINSGQAIAELMIDYKNEKKLNIKGSPTWILDNGRQVLYGNVSFPILEANILYLIK